MDNWIVVAILGRLFGYKGDEFYCRIFANSVDDLNCINQFYIKLNNQLDTLPRLFFKQRANKVLCKFLETPDNKGLPLFKGLVNSCIYASRSDFVALQKDEYYIVDLIGCKAVFDKKCFATVLDVVNYGGGDLFYLQKQDGLCIYIPFQRCYLENIDLVSRIIEFKDLVGLFEI